jgi:hypothetical protein
MKPRRQTFVQWAVRDSNPLQKHGENGASHTSCAFVDPDVDLDVDLTAELMFAWAILDTSKRTELLALARELSTRQ